VLCVRPLENSAGVSIFKIKVASIPTSPHHTTVPTEQFEKAIPVRNTLLRGKAAKGRREAKMCVIQGRPSTRYRISNTEIFVAPTIDNTQVTVYANRVVAKLNEKKKKAKHENQKMKGDQTINEEEKSDPTEAMILPVVSYDNGKDIELIDLSSWSTMFEDMDWIFRPPKGMTCWQCLGLCCMCLFCVCCCGLGSSARPEPPTLQVHRVGSYEVSIVPTKDDFDRLDKDVFVLDPKVSKLFAG